MKEIVARFHQNVRADPDLPDNPGEAFTTPVYWKGRQWVVSDYGIEQRTGHYPIAAARLWEDESKYGWIDHMADKSWVDIEDFACALVIARSIHRKSFKQ